MKFLFALLLLTLFGIATCLEGHQKVIFTFPNKTPQNTYEKAKESIIKTGGVITHEFDTIKSFVATLSSKAMKEASAEMAISEFPPAMEVDGDVHTFGTS